jgi:protein gp37
MKNSAIAWCHHSLNFWQGCSEVSKECAGCYARTLMENKKQRFHVMRLTQTWGSAYTLNAEAERQGKCAFIFASSLTDFWHPDADRWRADAWSVIGDCKNIIWLMLTKRPERIRQHLPPDWDLNFRHCWLGTTCGQKASYPRVEMLRRIPCTRRFLSIEPLLEDVSDINLEGIDWILVGGMSGEKSVEMGMNLEWAARLYDRTRGSGVKFFWKQVAALSNERGSNALGLYLAERNGCEADPATVDLIREYPDTPLPLMPLNREKGHRFTAKQWEHFKRQQFDLVGAG